MAQAIKGSPGRPGAGPTTILTRSNQSVLAPGAMNRSPVGVASSSMGVPAPQSNMPTMLGQQNGAGLPAPGTMVGAAGATSPQTGMMTQQSGMMTQQSGMMTQQSGMTPQSGMASQSGTVPPSASNVPPPVVPPVNADLANTKEKTPMCLVNELARFNKVQPQYELTDEQGPAHKKTFFVKLKLGNEAYDASGPSIKKAQHAAAEIALEKTSFRHPPPKPMTMSQPVTSGNPSVTPTVELNALAMKRGEPAVYLPIEPSRPPYCGPPNFDFRGMYNQRYHYPKTPRVFYISLKVGQREFIGDGPTRQAARHSAAEKALRVLRCLSMPDGTPRSVCKEEKEDDEGDGEETEKATPTTEEAANELKSEISLVHEIALKRAISVNFEILKESGPPHMKTFVTCCTCGTLSTEGVGNSKKLSKKHAAELMLEELKKLPPIPQPKVKKLPGNKKKNRNLIKVQKANMDYGIGINPISRLIQIQQAKKEKEPVYTLVAERGLLRRREFVIEVTVGDETCNGIGPNKKLAKRNAAEQMLQQLGYNRPTPQPPKSSIKASKAENTNGDKKVKFLDQEPGTARQLVPGVLVLPDGARPHGAYKPEPNAPDSKFSKQTTAVIAKELLDTGMSPTAEALINTGVTVCPVTSQAPVRAEHQLIYLGKVLGFTVDFNDFPKGTDKEHLSLVLLSTKPPHVSHGHGPTIEDSHDMAALTALKALAEMGLDNITPDNTNHTVGPAGDGPNSAEKRAKSAVNVKTEPA